MLCDSRSHLVEVGLGEIRLRKTARGAIVSLIDYLDVIEVVFVF